MNADRLLTLYDRVADAPDAIARLRRFVLDLAVRGKLVAQDPSDGSAAALLKRIAVERDRLLRAGEIKIQKPILPLEQSDGLYDVPKNWQWARFNEVASIQSNLVDPKDYLDLPHIAPDNIESWTARLLPYVTVKEAGVVSGKHLFAAGSIIYSKIRPNLAKVTVVDFDGLCSADMYPVRAHINRDFLVKFMITNAFVDQSVSEDNRVAMPKINQAALSNILVPLPPLAEQRRIVAKVDELMALLDRLEAARTQREAARDRLTAASLARLTAEADLETARAHARFALDTLPALTTRPDQIKTLRQTILNLAVRGKLVEQDPADEPAAELFKRIAAEKARLRLAHSILPLGNDDVPFSLPVGWIWSRIGEICSKTGSGSTPRGGKDVYKKSGIPFLRSQNVYNEGLRLDDVAFIDAPTHKRMNGTRVLPGDLLLNITGGSMGRCGRVPSDFDEANVSQHVAIIRPAIKGIDAFLHNLVLSPYFQAFIFDEQTGAGRGGLPKNRMDNIAVPVPPLAEQHRIVAKVEALMALCDRLETALADADATRQRLLEALLHEALAPATPAAPALEAAE